ncbi:MAG: potassium channel family protein [Akkermansia muciniphila]|nr:TrkA family potassium uptake protein [Akkermansia muciniphila]MCI7005276.1 TrkA family potassium uptake protein [Akkermansia muciniphila]
MDDMEFVVLGLGQFGYSLATSLAAKGYEVRVLDKDMEIVNSIQSKVSMALQGDATETAPLRELSVDGENVRVIIAFGTAYEKGILVAARLLEMGVKDIYVRSTNDLHANVMRMIGIKECFRVEEVAATQLAETLLCRGMTRLRRIDRTHSMADVLLPEAWVGRTLMEVGLRSTYHLNLVTLRRGKAHERDTEDEVISLPEQPVIGTPAPDMRFEAGDTLVLFGKIADLRRFAEEFQR